MQKRNGEAAALDPIHCRAICDEIGERLCQILKVEAEIPQRLRALLDKLDDLEPAPSIVPTIDEVSSLPRYNPSAQITRSNDLSWCGDRQARKNSKRIPGGEA
jgi:hypothetical protein